MTKQHAVPDLHTTHTSHALRKESGELDATTMLKEDVPGIVNARRTSAPPHGVTASSILQLQRVCGNKATQDILRKSINQPAIALARDKPIQRYTREDAIVAKQFGEYRISDDMKLAVWQDTKSGSQQLLAEPGMAATANQDLHASNSAITLEEKDPKELTKVDDKGGNDKGTILQFVSVIPKNITNNTKGIKQPGMQTGGMQTWADCGKTARDIMGAGQGTGGGDTQAMYNKPPQGEVGTTALNNPGHMKREIINKWLPAMEILQGYDVLNKAQLQRWLLERKKSQLQVELAMRTNSPTLSYWYMEREKFDSLITEEIMNAYNKLTSDNKESMDQATGINRWAAPNVGEGYTISTGGPAKPGHETTTWNFHWAGVVMKSGGDTVTLENVAVGNSMIQNTDWKYQMYGSAQAAKNDSTKKGQTFHEQHRDVHQWSGETPTTMKVKKR